MFIFWICQFKLLLNVKVTCTFVGILICLCNISNGPGLDNDEFIKQGDFQLFHKFNYSRTCCWKVFIKSGFTGLHFSPHPKLRMGIQVRHYLSFYISDKWKSVINLSTLITGNFADWTWSLVPNYVPSHTRNKMKWVYCN